MGLKSRKKAVKNELLGVPEDTCFLCVTCSLFIGSLGPHVLLNASLATSFALFSNICSFSHTHINWAEILDIKPGIHFKWPYWCIKWSYLSNSSIEMASLVNLHKGHGPETIVIKCCNLWKSKLTDRHFSKAVKFDHLFCILRPAGWMFHYTTRVFFWDVYESKMFVRGSTGNNLC